MKKTLLSFCLIAGMGIATQAQVVFAVESPAFLQGNYPLNYAKAADGWGVADLTNPANAVLDTLAFAEDGSASDSLACDELINGSAIYGKIAVIYRGACQFGTKAKNAQNKGAVAVIIINNVPDDVTAFGMLGGDSGMAVTIPVIMINQSDGALLKSQIEAGNVVGFIGNKFGYYADDIGFARRDILMAPNYARPLRISETGSEYPVPLGAWVYNFGTQAQTNVVLNATIELNSNNLYNQTSSPLATLAAGDSAWIALPIFSPGTYLAGKYEITYNVSASATDDFAADNTLITAFHLTNDMYSLTPLDNSNMPIATSFYKPSAASGDYEACIHFMDPNGSRVAVEGMYFAVTTTAADSSSLPGTFVETVLYSWNDSFTDLNDPNLAFDNLTGIAFGFYNYTAVSERGQLVYAPFDNPTILADNQRYLFCVKTTDDYIYIGYNSSIDYETTVDYHLQPVGPIGDGGTYYALGFGTEQTTAIGVKMFDKNYLGVEEEQTLSSINPYPNPVQEMLYIPMGDLSGKVRMDIMDIAGKLVKSEVISVNGTMAVNVTGLAAGQYNFRITLEDNTTRNFKVVVSK
ncbi:MAG: T9SS type A sorting domain-containing protein [Candidatus Competibacteraceae bacterium]|nr:T9SS type A sorting domain-containing protein [Candidatus Competibacteraceae bacterium]